MNKDFELIYVPDTRIFLPSSQCIDEDVFTSPLETVIDSYSRLHTKMEECTQVIGVIAFSESEKGVVKKWMNHVSNPSTTYAPIALIDYALGIIETIEPGNLISHQEVYREMTTFLRNPLLSIFPESFGEVDCIATAVVGFIGEVRNYVRETSCSIDDPNYSLRIEGLLNELPSKESFHGVREKLLAEFQKNDVPLEFPLHHILPGTLPYYLSYKLSDIHKRDSHSKEIVIHDHFLLSNFLDYLKLHKHSTNGVIIADSYVLEVVMGLRQNVSEIYVAKELVGT